MRLRLALVGYGVVARGFITLLREKMSELRERYDVDPVITGVATLRRGALYHPDGLDLALLANLTGQLAAYPDVPGLERDLFAHSLITQPDVDAVIELTATDWATGEPATSHVRAAFAAGRHVITANKGPVGLFFHELNEVALEKHLFFGYEGTVMGGTPVIRLAEMGLAGAGIHAFSGILNSTTNFILTQMDAGQSYADALAEAQARGYAEADPTNDVEGFDAAGKLIILCAILFGKKVTLSEIDREGITGITPEQVRAAQAEGKRWKLLARASRDDSGKVQASVRPVMVPLSDPLASVSSSTAAMTFKMDVMGDVTLIGDGAGGRATGFAVLSDVLALRRFLHTH